MYLTLLCFFFILCLLPFRGFKKQENFTLESTQYLKLILTLAILWHHMPGMGIPILDRIAGLVGRYGVSVFFFLSGYGLMKGLVTQGSQRYLQGFFRKRYSKLFIPLLIAFCCYALFHYRDLSLGLLIHNFSVGSNFVSYAYFVEVLCILYLIFFFTFRFFSIRVGVAISWVASLLLMYLYICLDYHGHWWISTLGFPMGISLALIKQPSKVTLANLTGVFFCLLACYKIGRYYTIDTPEVARYNFALFMTPLLCIFCFLVMPSIKTKLIAPCSWVVNNSYEIYLLQGLIIGLFARNYGVNDISMWAMFLTLILVAYVARILARTIDERFLQLKR